MPTHTTRFDPHTNNSSVGQPKGSAAAPPNPPKLGRLAVIGGGWAGCAAAVAATEQGWAVDLYEAAPAAGGRAKAIAAQAETDTDTDRLDNGQHILLGAYSATLELLRTLGVDTHDALLRSPLDLRDNAGQGFALPTWAGLATSNTNNTKATIKPVSNGASLRHQARMACAAVWSVWQCRHWPMTARLQLLMLMVRWRLSGFTCHSQATVADLCNSLAPCVMHDFIEPLCVSALNLSPQHASGALWLRVLKDALLSGPGSSDLLLPRRDLSALFVHPCLAWLRQHGATVHTGTRVTGLLRVGNGWQLNTALTPKPSLPYDQIVVATPAAQTAALVWPHNAFWAQAASALTHTSIATVYAQSTSTGNRTHVAWRAPMLALRGGAAQFVFNRSQLLSPASNTASCHIAAVVSDSGDASRDQITASVMQQLATQWPQAQWVWTQTVVEKRACFACTPQAARPVMGVAPGLWACGDYVFGPYPSTLEGAVRSAQAVVSAIARPGTTQQAQKNLPMRKHQQV
jgi:hydroxysqualene dehydroxylase